MANLNEFKKNYRETCKALERRYLQGFAWSFGEVYGVRCAKPGKFDDMPNEAQFELHTALGEFKIRNNCWTELGLFYVDLGDGLEIRYTDVRLVVAMGLLELGKFDALNNCYRFGDERRGCHEVDVGFDGDQWIELRGMSEDWAWQVANRMGFPRCLDRFEHFCRDMVWIDEQGKLVTCPNRILECNSRLLVLNECCMGRYRERDIMPNGSDVVPRNLMKSLFKTKDLLQDE